MTASVECRDRRGKTVCRHRTYKLDCADFEALWQRAGGVCEICGRDGSETGRGILVIDHDPAVGQAAVRGLLCNRCNGRLHEGEMAGPARDRYLANAWHLTNQIWTRPGVVMVRPRPTHEEAARDGLRAAGIATYISKPMLRAIINGLDAAGLLADPDRVPN